MLRTFFYFSITRFYISRLSLKESEKDVLPLKGRTVRIEKKIDGQSCISGRFFFCVYSANYTQYFTIRDTCISQKYVLKRHNKSVRFLSMVAFLKTSNENFVVAVPNKILRMAKKPRRVTYFAQGCTRAKQGVNEQKSSTASTSTPDYKEQM